MLFIQVSLKLFVCLCTASIFSLNAGRMSEESVLPSKSTNRPICIIRSKKSVFEKVAIEFTKKREKEILRENAELSRENTRLNRLIKQMQADSHRATKNTNQGVATTTEHCFSLMDALAKRGQEITVLKRQILQLNLQVKALCAYYFV